MAITCLEAHADLRITEITPSGGNVPPGHQISIKFDKDVIAFGETVNDEILDSISIRPAIDCSWQWVNLYTLVCNLSEALNPATNYELTIASTFSSIQGESLPGRYVHEFTTVRPEVQYIHIASWQSPVEPTFLIIFNQPVILKSLEDNLEFIFAFEQEGIPAELSKSTFIWGYNEYFELNDNGEWEELNIRRKLGSSTQVRYEYFKKNKNIASTRWLVQPARALKPNSLFRLKAISGIQSIHGSVPNAYWESNGFHTYGEFKLIGIRCVVDSGSVLGTVNPYRTLPMIENCDPDGSVSLVFTSPVLPKEIDRALQFSPGLALNRDKDEAWTEYGNRNLLNIEEIQDWRNFQVSGRHETRIPKLKTPQQAYRIFSKGTGSTTDDAGSNSFRKIRDVFGRELEKEVDIRVTTSDFESRWDIGHNDIVLESTIPTDIPVGVSNVDNIDFNFEYMTNREFKCGMTHSFETDVKRNVRSVVPLGIRNITNNKSIIGSVTFRRERYENSFKVQVTPLNILVRSGRNKSIVWVVNWDDGKPIKNAQVALFSDRLSNLCNIPEPIYEGKTNAFGLFEIPGDLFSRGHEENPESESICFKGIGDDSCDSYSVLVKSKNGIAMLPLNWDTEFEGLSDLGLGVYPSRTARQFDDLLVWGMTSQGAYKPGEVVKYKVYVRQVSEGDLLTKVKHPYTLRVVGLSESWRIDPNNVIYERSDIELDEFGSFDGTFEIPLSVTRGRYLLQVKHEDLVIREKDETFLRYVPYATDIVVSDYSTAPFKISNALDKQLYLVGETTKFSAEAVLHSGGPYTQAQVHSEIVLFPGRFNPALREHTSFYFENHVEDNEDSVWNEYGERPIVSLSEWLDDDGTFEDEIDLTDRSLTFGTLLYEASITDDRGKSTSTYSDARYFSVDRLVGLKVDSRKVRVGKPVEAEFVVVDIEGNPVNDTSVIVEFELNNSTSVYTYPENSNWEFKHRCEFLSVETTGKCSYTPSEEGEYRIRTKIEDTNGRRHSSSKIVNTLWYRTVEVPDTGNDLQVALEEHQVGVGDLVRLLVQNAVPQVPMLITVERGDILKQWTKVLEDSSSAIEFKMLPEYAPRAVISVAQLRPSQDVAASTDKFTHEEFEQGKPKFQLKHVRLEAKDKYFEMDLKVTTDKNTYSPRDRVFVDVKLADVRESNSVELAAVVLDESVLDLLHDRDKYFDIYELYHKPSSFGFSIFSYDLSQLIDRRLLLKGFSLDPTLPRRDNVRSASLEVLKGMMIEELLVTGSFIRRDSFNLSSEDDAGFSKVIERELLDSSPYWNPSIRLNKEGMANFDFVLPDNITGWRVFVIAANPTNRFGMGQVSLKTQQDTEVSPIVPNQVAIGDSFDVGVSVFNRTTETREFNVTLVAEGSIPDGEKIHTDKVSVEPFSRQPIWVGLNATDRTDASNNPRVIDLRAHAVDATEEGDALSFSIPVLDRRRFEHHTLAGSADEVTTEIPVVFPSNIVPDIGALETSVTPSILTRFTDTTKFVSQNRFKTWEVLISNALLVSQFDNLKRYFDDSDHIDTSGIDVDDVLAQAEDYQTSEGGMSYFTTGQYSDPYLSAYTALGFQWLKADGYVIPAEIDRKLMSYLRSWMVSSVRTGRYSPEMCTTVDGMILYAFALSGDLDEWDLKKFGTKIPELSLFGLAHATNASVRSGFADDLLERVLERIQSQANRTSTKVSYNDLITTRFKLILYSALRSNCALLSSFVQIHAKRPELVDDWDIRNLARSILDSQQVINESMTTQERVFCGKAIEDYASVFETETPDMSVRAALHFSNPNQNLDIGDTTFQDFRDSPLAVSSLLDRDFHGRSGTLYLTKKGDGRFYYDFTFRYQPHDERETRTNAGFGIRREYQIEREGEWHTLTSPEQIERGDVVKVDLFVTVPSIRHHVLIEDLVPGGLEPVDPNLATSKFTDFRDSLIYSESSFWHTQSHWIPFGCSRDCFNKRELAHEYVRFHAEYLNPGNYVLSWVGQAIATGEFTIPAAKVTETYSPNIYGQSLSSKLLVQAVSDTQP